MEAAQVRAALTQQLANAIASDDPHMLMVALRLAEAVLPSAERDANLRAEVSR